MSNQQYRHTNRKLTPAELVELLTDQHSAMADDPIILWMSMSLEDIADVITRAIQCSDADLRFVTELDQAITACALGNGQDAFDDWRQS